MSYDVDSIQLNIMEEVIQEAVKKDMKKDEQLALAECEAMGYFLNNEECTEGLTFEKEIQNDNDTDDDDVSFDVNEIKALVQHQEEEIKYQEEIILLL